MLHFTHLLILRTCAVALAIWLASAQSAALAYDGRPRFDQSALDAMIAPVALYPDQLLTQVLMAATYPREVEEAARWVRARPGLSGDAAVRTAEGADWDPSVRSLTAFPHVLDTMARHMAWTEDLGHAFIVQPQEVMDTVQRLRFRAYEAGTLSPNESTRVVNTGSSLIIESIRPEVVYVPYYDTTVAYGPWWWPARPPMYWPRWHGYYDPYGRGRIVHWGPGTWVSSGFFFGGFDWPRREVRVINTRPYYYHYRDSVHAPHRGPHVWRHDHARNERWRHQHAQPTERSIQAQPRAPQTAPMTGALPPREAQPQVTEGESRREQVLRMRRPREQEENGARVGVPTAPLRSGANPAAQERAAVRAPAPVPSVPAPGAPQIQAPAQERSAPASAAPREGERLSVEERRSRARTRERD